MIKGIIFDLNRTLYIPDFQKIPQETIELLEKLKKMGFVLALISINEFQREDIIKKYKLSRFFSIMKFVDEKSVEVFEETLKSLKWNCHEVVAVGDRIKSEIKIANMLGIKTIWYKNGKFSEELPIYESEFPNWTIDSLPKMIEILNKINTSKIYNRKSNK